MLILSCTKLQQRVSGCGSAPRASWGRFGEGPQRTSLPWVQHTWPKWEVEPLRWIGINFGLNLAKAADRREEKTGKASKLAEIGNWLRGKRS